MSSIKLTADSGGGTFEIKAPSSGSNARVLTVPDTANGTVLTTTNPKSGSIIQVVSTNVDSTSDIALSTQYSYYEITPLTTNITTTVANSKILVSAGIGGEANHEDYHLALRCGRVIGGSLSIIFKGADAGSRTTCLSMGAQGYHDSDQNSTTGYNSFANMLDSPSQAVGTTITYKFFVSSLGGNNANFYLNRTVGNTDTQSHERTFSYLTLMEVAA
jgi:hypothetical protein